MSDPAPSKAKPALVGEPDHAPLDAPAAHTLTYVDGCAHLIPGGVIGYDETCDLMVGRDLRQAGFAGFTARAGEVHVGPCHPVYVALNVAWQHGAARVTVAGLSDSDQQHLSPWLEAVRDLLTVEFN